jgi:protein-tyrosine phosphatase
MSEPTLGVLFVCLGNICRSPTAQGILEKRLVDLGLEASVLVDSCGTAGFNAGKPPDPRAVAAASRAGYSIGQQVARQIDADDYRRFDYLLAMDRVNLSSIEAWAPEDFDGEAGLLLHYGPRGGTSQVADPFYAADDAFDDVIRTLESAVDGLLNHLLERHPSLSR